MSKKSLLKNSLYNSLYNLVNVILPLVTSVYASRILLPEGVGKVADANNFVSYFVTLSALGLPTYGISAISKVKTSRSEKSRVFSELFLINSVSTTIAAIIYICIIFSLPYFRDEINLYFVSGIQLVLCYANIDWLYRGQEEYGYITKRNIVVKILSLLSLILLVKDKDDYLLYALITSCALGANNLFNIINARKFISLSFKSLKVFTHVKPLLFLAISLFFGSIYSRIDVTMLGIMCDDTAVGLYSNGHKVINIVITACNAITAVFLPRMSYLYKNDREEFIRLLNYGIKIIAFISIPATIGMMLLSNDATILLYGKEFERTGVVLMFFSSLIVVKSFGDLICYQTIISIGKEKSLVPAAAIAMFINIVFNFFLIPDYREIGATVASVISEFAVNILLYIYVKRNIKMQISIKYILKICTSTLIMGLAVWIVQIMDFTNLWTCVCGVIIGIIVFLLCNYLLRNELMYELFEIIKERLRRRG